MNPWEQVKCRLAAELPHEAYQNWLEPSTLDRVDGRTLYVKVPDDATKLWIQEEYRSRIQQALLELDLPYQEVVCVVSGANGTTTSIASENPPWSLFEPQLNPRYTFSTFVVGSSNQFAHAAARAVATRPGRAYNPLFIYGGTGLGKTHLMQAIGHSLRENFPGLRVVYTTSEGFMNHLVRSVQSGQMELFRQCYRYADALLVDDIELLANKERTQEEFFHTFNELYERQKQIVLSSDAPPSQTPGIVDRLRSRFEWGLMVDIQPPDLETKMAILEKKAQMEGIHLPEDVKVFIATRTRSNVRELEAALIKLAAYASVTRMPIEMNMARQVLRDMGVNGTRRVSLEAIVRAVAEHFGLQPHELKQKSNARRIAYPRQIAMYLAKQLTPASYPEIGRYFGGKHHTTVIHSVEKIGQLRQRDADLNRLIQRITDSLC